MALGFFQLESHRERGKEPPFLVCSHFGMFKFGGNSFGFRACHQKQSLQTGCLSEPCWGTAGSSFCCCSGVFLQLFCVLQNKLLAVTQQ